MKKTLLGLLIILATMAVLLSLAQLDGLYRTIETILSIVGLPLIMSLLLYYVSNPIVNKLEESGLKRKPAVALFLVIAIVVLIVIWIIVSPMVYEQAIQFFNNIPAYFNEVSGFLEEFFNSEQFNSIIESLTDFNIVQTIQDQWQNIVSATIGGINNVIGVVGQVGLVLFTTPFILYYMLVGQQGKDNKLLKLIPTKYRKTMADMFSKINLQLSQYIRGQLLVALGVGIMLGIMFSIIGLDYALILGIIAGILNVIPYFGSFIGLLIALIIAAVNSPFMIVKTLIVFSIEQVIEGRILSPLVLGANLDIHPLTVLFVLLIGAKFMGVLGAFVSIPLYTIIRTVFTYLFDWFKQSRPDLYTEEPLDESNHEASSEEQKPVKTE